MPKGLRTGPVTKYSFRILPLIRYEELVSGAVKVIVKYADNPGLLIAHPTFLTTEKAK